jgi:predicted O-methyltransferase YrrM
VTLSQDLAVAENPTPNQGEWTRVDAALCDHLLESEAIFEDALAAARAAGLPEIQVAPNQGKLLSLLARAAGARRILEIGTLGGYSTLWLARALPREGRLVTLEIDPRHAAVARENLTRGSLLDRVEIRIGPAIESLESLASESRDPFDLVFIDADKESTAEYFHRSLDLCRKGALIVVDNVVRGGRIANAGDDGARVAGIRRFLEAAGAEPRVDATAVQTVGSKGWDGFALLLVRD